MQVESSWKNETISESIFSRPYGGWKKHDW